jgi:FtsH-binding integral membrane protein
MSRSERVYRVLLQVCPGDFRREYGPRMEQAFGDLYREAYERGGRRGIALLWSLTISDLARTAVAQRIRPRADHEEVAMYDRRLAVVGCVLLLAPLYFVSASLLKYGLGIGFLFDPLETFLSVPGRRVVFNVVSPFVFLGGLCLALALNIYAVTRLNVSREDGTIVSTVRIKLGLWNIAVATVSVLLLVTLVGYAFLENFTYRP